MPGQDTKLLARHGLTNDSYETLLGLVMSEYDACEKEDADLAVSAVLKVLKRDDLPLLQMTSSNTKKEDIDLEYMTVFQQLIDAYFLPVPFVRETPGERVKRVWNEQKKHLTPLNRARVVHEEDARKYPAISEMSFNNRRRLCSDQAVGYWLVEKDVRDVAQQFGLKKRLATLPLEGNDSRVLAEHLRGWKDKIEKGNVKKPCTFYVAFSTSNGSIKSPGSHWIPLKVVVKTNGKLRMKLELSKNAQEWERLAKEKMLKEAADAAKFEVSRVKILCSSNQQDEWSSGYRALWRIAKWEQRKHPDRNGHVKRFAKIRVDNLRANQEDISKQLRKCLVTPFLKLAAIEEKRMKIPQKRIASSPTQDKKGISLINSEIKSEINSETWSDKLVEIIKAHPNDYKKVAASIIPGKDSKGKRNDEIREKILQKQGELWNESAKEKIDCIKVKKKNVESLSNDEKLAWKLAAEEALAHEEEETINNRNRRH